MILINKYITTYIRTNLILIILGINYYNVYLYNNYILILFYTVFKNFTILFTLDYYKKLIDYTKLNKKKLIKDILIGSFIELFIIKFSYFYKSSNIIYDCILFIPKTFLFELIFDFFHYWFHRLLHTKYLYFLHKQHHQFSQNISIEHTFNHNILDLVISNLMPMYLTSQIIYLSDFQFIIFLIYKTFIEFAGHIGSNINKKIIPSFPQFYWLPKYFNIEMYSIDHYLHHATFNYNYSKRFVLWDKIFNTYYQ